MDGLPTRTWVALVATITITTAVVGTATVAVANHVFPDVPTSSPFHEPVAAVAGAGIASGFPDGTFRPRDPVTRQQFALWTHRSAGRVAYDSATAQILLGTVGAEYTDTGAEVSITSDADPDGGGLVVLTATANAGSGFPAACPCRVGIRIQEQGSMALSPVRPSTLSNQTDAFAASETAMALTWIRPIEGGQTLTFRLQGGGFDSDVGLPAVQFQGDLTALYVPFDGEGSGPN